MTKHLMISGGRENWILSDATDLDGLRRTIERAMKEGEVLQLPVLLGGSSSTPVTMLLNCGALPSAVLIDNDDDIDWDE